MEHELAVSSYYCIHCGQGKAHILDNDVPCTRAENVVAISHIIADKFSDKYLVAQHPLNG